MFSPPPTPTPPATTSPSSKRRKRSSWRPSRGRSFTRNGLSSISRASHSDKGSPTRERGSVGMNRLFEGLPRSRVGLLALVPAQRRSALILRNPRLEEILLLRQIDRL